MTVTFIPFITLSCSPEARRESLGHSQMTLGLYLVLKQTRKTIY